jgi:hypothetical protein
MPTPTRGTTTGPFLASQIREGDPYELSNGHPIECLPAGSRHQMADLDGARVLLSDPGIRRKNLHVGIDVGVAFNGDRNLRAPDIAVGLTDREPGWARTIPPLAVEYADRGTDEEDLQDKLVELLEAGTRIVWVVRLVGPLRVEVYARGEPMRVVEGDGILTAPDILDYPVSVRALVEPRAADAAVLRNLLHAMGRTDPEPDDLVEVTAAAASVMLVLRQRGLRPTADEESAIRGCLDRDTVLAWLQRAFTVASPAELFD